MFEYIQKLKKAGLAVRSFVVGNWFVIVPLILWSAGQGTLAWAAFVLGLAYEGYIFYQMRHIWYYPLLYKFETTLYGKPLIKELWQPQEREAFIKAKWKWQWRLPHARKSKTTPVRPESPKDN